MDNGKRNRLRRDDRRQRGGIFVPAMFAIGFFIGVLYLVVGASSAMQHGVSMQDGVDAAAFSAAQAHAEAMNRIALLNRIKVAATASLIAPSAIAIATSDHILELRKAGDNAAVKQEIQRYAQVLHEAVTAIDEGGEALVDMIDSAERGQDLLVANNLADGVENFVNEHVVPTFAAIAKIALANKRTLPVVNDPTDERLCTLARTRATRIVELAFANVTNSEPTQRVAQRWLKPLCERYRTALRQIVDDPDAVPGGALFQVHVFAGGSELSTLGERGVAIAGHHANSQDSVSALRDRLSRVSFAQAEFYLATPSTRLDALMHAQWQARLRRFRWPVENAASDCARAAPSASCVEAQTFLQDFGWAVNH